VLTHLSEVSFQMYQQLTKSGDLEMCPPVSNTSVLRLRNWRNTRYGLLVRLCPTGTCYFSFHALRKKHQAALGAL